MIRVTVNPGMFRWARERAGFEPSALADRFPRLVAWERGEAQPTLKQLESFAQATYTPVGYLFLPEPPVENVPIPDFRTMGSERLNRPSADLLDTIYLCQQRQEWYRDFARTEGERPLLFVGSVSLASDVEETGASRSARWSSCAGCAMPAASRPRSSGVSIAVRWSDSEPCRQATEATSTLRWGLGRASGSRAPWWSAPWRVGLPSRRHFGCWG